MKKALSDALEARGYDKLTPVQEAVLEERLQGADLLVSAQTGSGKTLGFGLAIAPTILGEEENFESAGAPLALVIAPTRELALQVKRELSWLFEKAGAIVRSCVGGMDMRDERRDLSRGAHIVVATPGRLRDHISRASIDLSSIRAVVLDEADEMLDLGFREDLEFILGEAPDDRQTLLFSATVPKSIIQLAKNYQRDAERLVVKSETSQHADITYRAQLVGERDVENAVINTLRYFESPNAIVFANTRAAVNRMTTRLSNRGFKVVALSGELSQTERTHALQAMRDGRAQVCVATDVAARGIDLPNLDLVVHAELPTNHETLLHRSGRTGRAGRKGVSALIVTKKTRKKAERILSMAKLNSEWMNAPSADEVNARDEERMLASQDWLTDVSDSEQSVVERLQAEFTPTQLAAAYLRLYRTQRSAPEDLADVDAKSAPRTAFGPSVWFSVSGGRNAGAEPRNLLPMVCKSGDLTKDDIGAIRVRDTESFVEVLASSVDRLVKSVGPSMSLEEGAVLTQLAQAPDLSGGGFGGKPRPDAKSGGGYKGKNPNGPRGGDRPEWKKKDAGDKPDFKKRDSGDKTDWKKRDSAESGFKKPGFKKPDYKKPDYKKSEEGGKPEWKKREDGGKPSVPKKDYAPKGDAKPRVSTPKTDWNDSSEPRFKKPKGPHSKPRTKKPGAEAGKRDEAHGGAVFPKRNPHLDTSKRVRHPDDAGRGPVPPKGKPSSKKNRVRAANPGKAGFGGGASGGGRKPGGRKP